MIIRKVGRKNFVALFVAAECYLDFEFLSFAKHLDKAFLIKISVSMFELKHFNLLFPYTAISL